MLHIPGVDRLRFDLRRAAGEERVVDRAACDAVGRGIFERCMVFSGSSAMSVSRSRTSLKKSKASSGLTRSFPGIPVSTE